MTSGSDRRKSLSSDERRELRQAEYRHRKDLRHSLAPEELAALHLKEASQRREARRKQNPRQQENSWKRDRDFLAIDGEAIRDRYVLLACSDGSSIENPDGLKTVDCLRFLTTRKKASLWWFAGDYDVNNILAALDVTNLRRLSWANHALFGHYKIDHIPGKIFKVRDLDSGQHVTVWDVFSFVRTSFVDWLRDWRLAPPEEIEQIRKMKDRRSGFIPEDMAEIREYCFRELKYLQAGLEQLMDRVEKTGYHPLHWHSPASISAAVMRKMGVKDHMGKPPERVAKIAAQAYYGGRFETRVIGQLQGPLYHYDINSAYPAALEKLPCLACGSWHRVRDAHSPWALLKVSWRPRNRRYADPNLRPPWGPFPVRSSVGSLRYPLTGGPAWYWSCEVRAAEAISSIKVHQALEYRPGCDEQPFHWIPELYRQRQEWKRQGDETEYVLKLILNSTYGKLAQRPKHEKIPMFYSPVWAGLVTAHCRAQILTALGQDPDAALQIATDGLTTQRPLPFLSTSSDLGDWSMTELDMLFILQSGIYFWRDLRGRRVQRSRGFHPSSMTYRRCIAHWRRHPEQPMTFSTTRFLGYRIALQQNRMPEWRHWPTFTVSLGLTPEPRRETLARSNGCLWSVPPTKIRQHFPDDLQAPSFNLPWDEGDQPDGPEGDGGL